MLMTKTSVMTVNIAQNGFAIIELMVATGILSVIMSLTLTAVNPGKQFAAARNVQRQSNELTILDAIYEYEASNNGSLPPVLTGLTSTPVELAGGTGHSTDINLCPDLVPIYLADLPQDPSASVPTGGPTPCNSDTTSYNTGYTIAESAGQRITIATVDTQDGANISVTR